MTANRTTATADPTASGPSASPEAVAGHEETARAAAAAAAELAAAWNADPRSVAAFVRHRAVTAWAAEPVPDSCAMLERLKVSYDAFAALKQADPAAITGFITAEARYRDALARIEALP